MLTIAGERKFEKDAKDENYHRIERAYGAFTRSFTLPAQRQGTTRSRRRSRTAC